MRASPPPGPRQGGRSASLPSFYCHCDFARTLDLTWFCCWTCPQVSDPESVDGPLSQQLAPREGQAGGARDPQPQTVHLLRVLPVGGDGSVVRSVC